MSFVLNEFVENTKILPSKVNENFEGLQGDINDNYTELDGRLDTQATTLSSIQEIVANGIVTLSGTSPSLTDNKVHRISITGATTFSLPSPASNSSFHQMQVQITMSTVYSLDLGTTKYLNSVAPDMSNAGKYTLIYEHDGSSWYVGAMYRGAN